ncbi:MAG: hypothetical protein ABR905_22950 [Terracidiphilus sp.]
MRRLRNTNTEEPWSSTNGSAQFHAVPPGINDDEALAPAGTAFHGFG